MRLNDLRRALLTFPLFLIIILTCYVNTPNLFTLNKSSAISEKSNTLESLDDDVSLYDVWRGTVNESHPLYWGNYTYFMGGSCPLGKSVFFIQRGGVHNHACHYTVWNESVYIDKVTNAHYVPWNETHGQVIVHHNETRMTLSNGSIFWIPNRECPLCNASMHIPEFSPNSLAAYWYCHECRLFIGECLDFSDFV